MMDDLINQGDTDKRSLEADSNAAALAQKQLLTSQAVPDATPVSQIKAPTKVDAPTLERLHKYALLSTLAYSDDKGKVYSALESYAPSLFQAILPEGRKKKDVQMSTKDKLVRVVLLANPEEAGTAEAVLTFVGPDDLSSYEPNKDYPITTPVRKLDNWPKDVPADDNVMVYGTFARAFNDLVKGKDDENLSAESQKLAKSLGVTITKITCVGHGTGGAFATMSAFWMKKLNFPNASISCVSFGAPRVGNAAFAKAFGACIANSYRVVHKTDPLTDVPSYQTFQHVPGGILLYEPLQNDYGAPEMTEECYVALAMEPPAPLRSYLVEDNNVLKYVEGLQEAAVGSKVAGLADTLKQQWGGFTKSGWFSDNRSADEEEVRSMVKQLLRFQTGQVNLAPRSMLVKLAHYGTWAAAAYSHLVSDAETMLDGFYKEHAADADEFELPIPGTLRLVKGIGERLPIGIFLQTDTQALVGLLDDKKGGAVLVVAFRGSESTGDWATNFNVPMTSVDTLIPPKDGIKNDPRWRVHSGFTKSVKDIVSPPANKPPLVGMSDGTGNSPLNKELQPMKDLSAIAAYLRTQAGDREITRVVVCGHSLGGALSKLGAYWCQTVGFKNVPVENYSFGAPRVANYEFACHWRRTIKTVCRVVHRADPVPAVPFSSWLGDMDYHHVDDPMLLCQPKIQDFLASDVPEVPSKESYQAQLRARPTPLTAMVNLITKKERDSAISDHMMDTAYLPAVEGALKTLDAMLATRPDLMDYMADAMQSVLSK